LDFTDLADVLWTILCAIFFSFFFPGCDQFYPGTVSQSFFIAILLAFEKKRRREKNKTIGGKKPQKKTRKEKEEFFTGEMRHHRKFRVVEDFLSFCSHFSSRSPKRKNNFLRKAKLNLNNSPIPSR
jgi:hypothetical protein